MNEPSLEDVVRNVDRRLTLLEQILPTLPRREDVDGTIQHAIQEAVAPLATREEVHVAIGAEGERGRQYTRMLFEDLRDDNRIILEHLIALSARVDALARR